MLNFASSYSDLHKIKIKNEIHASFNEPKWKIKWNKLNMSTMEWDKCNKKWNNLD